MVEDNHIGMLFVVWYTDPKITYYWKKVLKVFSENPETHNNKAKMAFMLKKNISSNLFEVTWKWPKNEEMANKEIVDTSTIFFGSCKPEIVKGVIFHFLEEPQVAEAFKYLSAILE